MRESSESRAVVAHDEVATRRHGDRPERLRRAAHVGLVQRHAAAAARPGADRDAAVARLHPVARQPDDALHEDARARPVGVEHAVALRRSGAGRRCRPATAARSRTRSARRAAGHRAGACATSTRSARGRPRPRSAGGRRRAAARAPASARAGRTGGCAAVPSSEDAEPARRPVPHERRADDVALRQRAPDAAVLGALAVVAEHEVGVAAAP